MAFNFRVDVSNIENAFRDYERVLDDTVEDGSEEVLDQSIEALRLATPIDTGRARAGWYYQSLAPLPGFPNRFEIRNDVEYIDDLNDGTSQQAGPRFIERTLLGEDLEAIGPVIDRRS